MKGETCVLTTSGVLDKKKLGASRRNQTLWPSDYILLRLEDFFSRVRDRITEQGRTNKERIFITLLICCCFGPHNLCHFFVSEQCCGGKIGPNYGPRDSDCCGNQAFNSRISFCHGGTVYQRCNYKTYDPAAFLCCKGEVVLNDGGNNTKCCGKKSYNRYIKKYKASTRLLVLLSWFLEIAALKKKVHYPFLLNK